MVPGTEDTIACQSCGKVEAPSLSLHGILVCRSCGSSLVLNADGSTRKATALDIDALTPAEFQQLTKARAGIARPDRRQG